MDWQSTLIRVFVFVQDRFGPQLYALAQRQSNNNQPAFTDEEVLTIYLFGLMQKRRTIRDIHTYTRITFRTGFPNSRRTADMSTGSTGSATSLPRSARRPLAKS